MYKTTFAILFALIFTPSLHAQEIITFETQPDSITTNIPHFPVIPIIRENTHSIVVNNIVVPNAWGFLDGVYVTVPLKLGDNQITLSHVDSVGNATQTVKHIIYDPDYKTDTAELLYINHDIIEYDDPNSYQPGTTVIDVNRHIYLGTLLGTTVLGVNREGSKLFLQGGGIYRTASHTPAEKILPSYNFPTYRNEPLLFAHNGKTVFFDFLSIALDTLEITRSDLPRQIEYIASITKDDARIYHRDGFTDIAANTFTGIPYFFTMAIPSDVAIDPTERFLVTTSFGFAQGAMTFQNPKTGQVYQTIQNGVQGYMDFIGNILFSKDGKVAYATATGNPVLGYGGVWAVDLDTLANRVNDGQTRVEFDYFRQDGTSYAVLSKDDRLFTLNHGIKEYETTVNPVKLKLVRSYPFPRFRFAESIGEREINYKAPFSAACMFLRGDANSDGAIDIADAVSILAQLFQGGGFTTPNLDALDVNDDGAINITDAINLLEYLFLGSERKPAAPFPDLGRDTTPDEIPACVEK